MTPPALEIADLIRTAGAAFVERSRQWIRWKHVKLLGAAQEALTEEHTSSEDAPDLYRCPKCGGPMPKSNFVLHHGSALQHETALSNSNTPRASAGYAPVRLV